MTGEALLPQDVQLALGSGGELSLTANSVQIDGDIEIPSGSVSIASRVNGTQLGSITVAGTAEIDVRGTWVNDHPLANGGIPGTAPVFIDGGTVAITSRGDLTLEEGSVIDVSAGARLDSGGDLETGSAGSISLTSAIPDNNVATTLALGADLRGYGFDEGGTLKLAAASLLISDSILDGPPIPGQVTLASSFFETGGFGSFQLTADRGDLTVDDGTTVRISPRSLQLNGNHQSRATGTDIRELTETTQLFDFMRAPTTFSATVRRAAGVSDDQAVLRIGENASIVTELGGAITLAADTDLFVDGQLSAAGGAISLTLDNPLVANEGGYRADQGIWLGNNARLDASGGARVVTDQFGHRSGEVLDGGQVTLDARRGFIVTRPGSIVDVSGTQQDLDLPGGDFGRLVQTVVASDAGSISVRTAEGALLFGDLHGNAGGAGAGGGSFDVVVNEGTRDPNGVRINPAFSNLPQFLYSPREIRVVDTLVGDIAEGSDVPSFLNGQTSVAADRLQSGGFDVVDLTVRAFTTPQGPNVTSPGIVRFESDVSLTAGRRVSLNAGVIASSGDSAGVIAPYVSIGLPTAALPTLTVAPAAGSGRLSVEADHIDLRGATVFSGFAQGGAEPAISLSSGDDIHLIGDRLSAVTSEPNTNNTGSLTSLADIELSARQIYPATLTEFSVNVLGEEGRIVVSGGDATAATPLSAAAVLRLSASEIVQDGVLRAPFGTIELDASERVELMAGSITSTSGAGAIVPFGSIELGEDWVYSLGASTRVLSGAPEKNVILDAPEVTLAAGSVVDLSGGGDLLTYEFVKGPGGSRDILLGDNPEDAFAIVPTLGTQFGAIDPFESPSAAIEVGSTITLAGGSDVAAGEYAVLPARYALLPGAYLIRPVAGTGDLQPASAQLLPDGTTIVAGRRSYAGTDIQDARWSGFAVLNGDQVRRRSEFNEHLASDFFAELGGIPGNAGRLTIDANRSIRIDGSLAASVADGGRAAQVDFVADRIAIVGARTGATDRTELVDTELQNFAAASLLIGGSRRNIEEGIQLQISAEDVRVEDGAGLTASEIILAATDNVTVARGARLSGEGAVSGDDPESNLEYHINGNGAFARVSAGEQVTVERTGATGQSGSVLVEEGATLVADGSINLEASSGVTSAGDLLAAGGSLSLTASLISLGEAPTNTSGLVLSSGDLARFQAGELLLNSRSTIDFYGTVTADLNRVGLDAAGLRGFDNGGASAVGISARDLSLRNTAGTAPATAGTGTGALALHAATLTLDDGNLDISGFASTRLAASREFVGNEQSSLRAHGDLSIETPRLTGGMGADVGITADGALTTIAMPAPADLDPVTALGARLMLTGATITHGSRIETPSGIVSLHTTGPGGATLSSGSLIDVSGRDVDLLAATVGSPGGVVSVFADQGNVSIAEGASINVSGAASGGDAGRLTVRAPGDVQIASGATLRGNAVTGEMQGTLELDAGVLTNGFAALNSQLNGGGFTERRTLSLQTGDVTIGAGDTVNARVFELAANGGSIDLAGQINAAAAQGGRVRLSARDNLVLSGSAQIDARATGADEQGGDVELGTLNGTLTLASGSTISVAGTQANGSSVADGHVRLRAPRVGADSVAIAPVAGTISGAQRVDIEAFRAYDATVVDATLIGNIQADTNAYMANAAAIESALGIGGDERFHLLPGVEISSASDLTLASSWDLMDWRYQDEAGVLTLRAAGNLSVSQSLSDGFRTEFGIILEDGFTEIPARDAVQTGDSWSYRLVAGATTTAADPLAAGRGTGSVLVGDNVYVRTGAGDIDVVAGDDVVLSTAASAIYTAGENRGTGALDLIDAEVVLRGDFLHNGGDIRINAGGDVRGVSDQLLPLWLPRIAGEYPFYLTPRLSNVFPAAWAIDSSRFQGVGALGGGDIQISAGGNLDSVTVALPTTGQANALDGGGLSIAGGGDLSIDVGGDIRGGVYHLGRGDADIRSGGTITTASTGQRLLPILQLGDARISMQARKDVGIQTAFSPTVATQDPEQGLPLIYLFARPDSYFFTYSEQSAVSLTTVAGDADLFADSTPIAGTDQTFDAAAMKVYPGTLIARSLQGDVRVNDDINLFPSPEGTLEVLAGGDITSTRTVIVNLSDADTTLLPSVANPTLPLTSPTAITNLLRGQAPTPVHALDDLPVMIAARGTIGTDAGSGANSLTFDTSKQARVFAGEDVSNIGLFVQHNGPDDVTVVQAGRDIVYPIARDANGTFSDNGGIISIEGPGRVDLIAGRDVNFGVAQGVETVGDQRNPVLADSGADINIWTGHSTPPDYDAFIERYMVKSSDYSKQLTAYLERFPRDPSLSDVANFRALSRLQQRELVQQVFYAEIKKGGLSDFKAGFDAIATLFPEADDDKQRYQGNLTSFLSHIRTVDGGNINLMVPNGTVNAGLASSGSISKLPSQLGIVAQREGDISAFVHSDFLVNASRVFSLDGGDVLIWSSEGDIDAGRGSRSALAIPPPITSVDQNGNVVVEFPPAISGSGIRTAVSTPGRKAGDVFLFAPQGVVNAGDAGIASGGNLTIAATEVIGADNIEVGGVSVGVPTDTGGLGTSLAGVSSVASSASSTVDAGGDDGQGDEKSATKLADTALSWLEVFVVGLGEDSCRQDDVECLKRQRPNN